MMNFKKILVPMDFSACAKNAFQAALKIAKSNNSAIELVSVAHMPHLHAEAMGAAAIVQPILTETFKEMDESFKRLIVDFDTGDIEISDKKFNSTLRDALFSCLEADEIDLVITGTKSKHNMLENLVGSNSVDIVNLSKVPVIVIPEHINTITFKNIGVALDYKDFENVEQLAPLKRMAELFNSNLHFLNVTKTYNKLFVYDDQKVVIAEFFNGLPQSFHTYSDERKLTDILLSATHELKLDMLFMLPKSHSVIGKMLHPSKTKSVAMKIDIPLMTVHE
jgi:nucleotide-binding universal stress UspA family protein